MEKIQRLKKIVKKHNLDPLKISQLLNVSRNAVYHWLRVPYSHNFRMISDEHINKLEQIFKQEA